MAKPVKRRSRIEIVFGRPKDWCRIAAGSDRSPKVFLSAIDLVATVMFWPDARTSLYPRTEVCDRTPLCPCRILHLLCRAAETGIRQAATIARFA